MANIKSQIKRNRQNESRRQRNRARSSGLRTKIKNFLSAAEAGDQDAARKLAEVNKALDQAADSGMIHANRAANQKSRLAKKLTP
jgi:small subunit ribosomal protein S20